MPIHVSPWDVKPWLWRFGILRVNLTNHYVFRYMSSPIYEENMLESSASTVGFAAYHLVSARTFPLSFLWILSNLVRHQQYPCLHSQRVSIFSSAVPGSLLRLTVSEPIPHTPLFQSMQKKWSLQTRFCLESSFFFWVSFCRAILFCFLEVLGENGTGKIGA